MGETLVQDALLSKPAQGGVCLIRQAGFSSVYAPEPHYREPASGVHWVC